MKICPQCQGVYEEDLNYCLNDGAKLVDYQSYDPQNTIPYSGASTGQVWNQGSTQETHFANRYGQSTFGNQQRRSNSTGLFMMIGAVFTLIGITLAGIAGVYWLNRPGERKVTWSPTPTPYRSSTPTRTSTPEKIENIKIDILEPVKADMGQRYLKVKVTNASNSTVEAPSFSLSFYKKDVKIKDAYGKPELPYLKPNQSVPVWINLYGTDNYTEVKLKEPVMAQAAKKSDEELFPKINLLDTKMVAEKEGMLYNFRQLFKMFYKVRGVAENNSLDKLSAKLFVLYYDEKGEVVGIHDTSLSDLKMSEKASFEASKCEIDLFGTPKTFEIIAIKN